MKQKYSAKQQLHIWAVTGSLLAIALSRSLLLNHITFDTDETRSAMRSFGTAAQIIHWTPQDWPPLHNLLLGAWNALVGPHPVTLRITSLLCFLIAAAITYRAAIKLVASRRAALSIMLVYASLGFSIFLSTYLRAYVLAMALFPLALWLMIRYFEHPRWQRAFLLSLSFAALFYTTYTAVIALAILGLYTLLVYRKSVWRWWLPGLFFIVWIVPEFIRKADYFLNRADRASSLSVDLPPLADAFLEVFQRYAGDYFLIWCGLFFLAVGLIWWNQRRIHALMVWSLSSALISPLILYAVVTIPVIYIFSARYTWWALLMFALVIGTGLAYLPRTGWRVSNMALLILMFLPASMEANRSNPYPVEQLFTWMQDHVQPGDVIVIDDYFSYTKLNWTPREDLQFAYYLRVLGKGLAVAESPDDQRRVWYLDQEGEGWHDEALKRQIETHRVAREWFGPWDFLMRLYEAPPDVQGIPFENGLRFHGLEVLGGNSPMRDPINVMAQDTIRIRLWWSIDRPVETEYSVSVQILAGSKLLASHDGPPQLVRLDPGSFAPLPEDMTHWEKDRYYVEERELVLPDIQKQSLARLYLTVYQWWDGTRIEAPGTDDRRLLPLQKITLWGR